MSTVRPTVKDVSRAVAALNEFQEGSQPDAGSILRVAENLAFVIGRSVKIHKVTRRDVQLMLAAHGASDYVIQRHANGIAANIRSNYADDHIGAYV
jgi:hypothetical protein